MSLFKYTWVYVDYHELDPMHISCHKCTCLFVDLAYWQTIFGMELG